MKKNKKSVSVFKERTVDNKFAPSESNIHIYGAKSMNCETESKGYATPKNRKPLEIVVDASEGFIPLWKKGKILRWRFSPSLYNFFQNPEEAMMEIRKIFSKGILAWKDATPIKFSERNNAWDFEITVKKDNCNYGGCTLASAFFPDSGRHQLTIYPKLFSQSPEEQTETMAHELGHIFGLRHFFANISEKAFPSVKFGQQNQFTIMNYNENTIMTDNDKNDLKALYEKVWSGELTEINGTRIVTFLPYHYFGEV